MFKKISDYFADVRQELQKVSWPTRQELYGSTVIVLVMCFILAIFVFGIDQLINRLLNMVV
jgi:preprotein translocase subunit SecE